MNSANLPVECKRENGDNVHCAPCLDYCTVAPILRPQRRQGSQSATGGDREFKAKRRDENGQRVQDVEEQQEQMAGRDQEGYNTNPWYQC